MEISKVVVKEELDHPWKTTEDSNHPESPDYKPNYLPDAKVKASVNIFAKLYQMF